MAGHPSPFDVDLDDFLSGGDDRELDIDTIFAKEFDDLHAEIALHDPEGLRAIGRDVPSLAEEGYVLRPVECGMLLIDPDGNAVGGYLSCDLAVDSAHRGLGLGRELVIERALRDGSIPTWHLDEPAYSPEGVACHESAWHHARSETEETRIRSERIRTDETEIPA